MTHDEEKKVWCKDCGLEQTQTAGRCDEELVMIPPSCRKCDGDLIPLPPEDKGREPGFDGFLNRLRHLIKPKEYCPLGHGRLKLWEGKARCYKCGWPVAQDE